MKILLKHSLLALLGVALLAPAANATSNLSVNLGDLIMGFRVTDGASPGASTNLEVDLGPASLFLTPSKSIFDAATLGLDLASIYGASWFTRTDLGWGIIGTTGNTGAIGLPARTLFDTVLESPLGTQAGAPDALASGAAATPNSDISTLYSAYTNSTVGGLNGAPSTGNGNNSAISSTASSSWSQQVKNTGVDFGTFDPAAFENNTNIGSYVASDLFKSLTSDGNAFNSSVYVGSFALNSAGKVTFATSVAAVPEPSTYGLIGLGAVVVLIAARRRQTVQA